MNNRLRIGSLYTIDDCCQMQGSKKEYKIIVKMPKCRKDMREYCMKI